MKKIFLLASLLLAAFLPVAAHDGHGGKLEIKDVWARETLGRTMSAAAYMTLKNGSHAEDILLSVESDMAAHVALHQSKMEGGKMMMLPVKDGLQIPAGKRVQLKPKSYHIMFMKLAKPLKKGDVFPLILTFKKAGKVTVYVEVRGIDGKAAEEEHHH